MFRRYSTHDFIQSGFDIKGYQWDAPQANAELNIAEKNFRISKGLLGGGIVSSAIGSGSLITAALESKSHNSITGTTTPLIITGIALNLIVMPVCFVMRDFVRKKAASHILKARVENHSNL